MMVPHCEETVVEVSQFWKALLGAVLQLLISVRIQYVSFLCFSGM